MVTKPFIIKGLDMVDYSFKEYFKYKHENPYHERLGAFSEFVLRDHEAEAHKGKWNKEVFKKEGELFLEIGTGAGHFMIDYCRDHPEVNFVGLDYRFKRSFALAKKLSEVVVKNFRYLRAKGERIEFMFEENELDGIFYFFPDPWPKTKHNKKRLIQEPFLKSAYKTIKPGGIFYIKTDHDDYALWMEREIKKCGLFDVILESKDLRLEHPDHLLAKYTTGFEKIFLEQGIKIKAFVLRSKK
ncbi:MAG: tRNA (guanosine(46)-N7)-methyltransferase TrmB [Bacteriovoracaceae bacterium]|nr:tRNA (guanosine(46)-N7)-methyltransferase TrmB [Bacteriovoracaceae bacterium]